MDARRGRARARRGVNGSVPADLSYSAATSVLLIADGPGSTARGLAAVVAAELPVVAIVGPADASDRLVALAGCAYLEMDSHPAPASLVRRLCIDADAGRYRAIVSTPAASIDLVAACIGVGRVQHLADASHADRVAALLAPSEPSGVRERGGSGADALRLRALTDEVGRIAGALTRLSGGALPAVDPPRRPAEPDADASDLAELARIAKARAMRGRYFDAALFADPAWDMLLDLTAARIAGKAVAVSSLCIAAAVPPTTALRWIKMLTDAGLFVRRADPADGRRVFVDLGDEAAAAMRAYLADVRRSA